MICTFSPEAFAKTQENASHISLSNAHMLTSRMWRQRQISKFAFVQDRLREWRPDVLAKIERFACMAIATLDIDGYRIDKGLTITVDAMAHWSQSIRACAKQFGKENFFISGMCLSMRLVICYDSLRLA